MLNHTYTSVKNANIVDCGKKQHIPSQPFPLLKENFLSEYRTELDKKKVLANLGIATDLSLEWEYIKGDIGRSESLMKELDSRTKYISKIDGFQKTVLEGINYLETVVGGEQEGEEQQNERLTALEEISTELTRNLQELKIYIQDNIEINLEELNTKLNTISEKVENITELIKVSTKEGNALLLISEESEEDGLYVPDLAPTLTQATENIEGLRTDVDSILDTYVTKDDLGGGSFDFVEQQVFDSYKSSTDQQIVNINQELDRTVKTGEDGHVDTLYVNTISKNNDENNIVITDSFEVNSGIPLDIRFVVETLNDLLSIPVNTCYSGMGVIVNSLSSLYILRKPQEGDLTQEYISNVFNWKCPEDLVTVALTREDYESLEEINPNVFYYIYEDEVTITKEPKREEYESEEEFQIAWQEWTNSLKTLSQEYMSASWGVDIEDKVSKKADTSIVTNLGSSLSELQQKVDSIIGSEEGISLTSLEERITETESDLEYLLGTEQTDEEVGSKGKIKEIEESIQTLENDITSTYVTKESITDETNEEEYIFVKKTSFNEYINSHNEQIAQSITTKQLNSEEVNTKELNINENTLSAEENSLLFNSDKIALDKQVPVIQVLSSDEYNNIEKNDNTYYYVYEVDNYYITKESFNKYQESQTNILNTLSNNITNIIGDIENLTTVNKINIVSAIKELVSKLQNLTDEVTALNEKVTALESI